MRLRPLAGAVIVLLLASLLTACRTNVGTAAKVGDQRISENTINSFVTPTGAASSAVADAGSRGSSLLPPKTLVVEFLVREAIFERALRAKGGLPSVGTLSALQDKALEAVLQIPSGASSNIGRDLGNQLEGVGVKRSLISHVIRWTELVYYLGAIRLKAASVQATFTAALKLAGHVTVAPRYGTWDATNLAVATDDSNGAPSYLKIRSTAATAP